jgi:hypothetical protein
LCTVSIQAGSGGKEFESEGDRGMKHELKTWTEYYNAVFDGNKTFEVRKNDRNYQVDDVLYRSARFTQDQ